MLSMLTIIWWKRMFFNIYQVTVTDTEAKIDTEHCHHKCPVAREIPLAEFLKDNLFPYCPQAMGDERKSFATVDDFVVAVKRCAHCIYLKYIKSGSALEVNIAHSVRRQLDSICGDLDGFLECIMDVTVLF